MFSQPHVPPRFRRPLIRGAAVGARTGRPLGPETVGDTPPESRGRMGLRSADPDRAYSPITDQRKPIMMKKPENRAISPIPP